MVPQTTAIIQVESGKKRFTPALDTSHPSELTCKSNCDVFLFASRTDTYVPCFSSRRLHYYAYFEHRDEPFDSSFKRRRLLAFRLGKCEVLPGFDLAVATMQRRERAKFIISSDLLYGQLGCPPHIPESAWCLYVVELSSTNEYSTVIHDEQLSIETANRQHIDDFSKRIRLAQMLRNTGNEEYANGHLERALRSYSKARQLIHNRVTLIDSKNEEQYHQLLLKLHLNSGRTRARVRTFAILTCS